MFHEASYGFRPGRNCHDALAAVLALHDQGHEFVLDADIKGFFDNLPFRVIMQAVAAEVADGNILRLVQKFLRSGVITWTGNSTTPAGASRATPTTSWCSAKARPKPKRR